MNTTKPSMCVIFGHGRSGSKVLQLVLAYILADQVASLDLYYEPLLWRDSKFSGVNRTAMRIHKSLPICADQHTMTARENRFFSAFHNGKSEATLIKYIRMTGRSETLHSAFPGARVLFLFRDPVAVMNSIKNWTVTLLGPPHYPSDLPRIVEYIERRSLMGRSQIQELLDYSWGGELLYWYATHASAVADLEARDTRVFSYERLMEDRESTLRRLCLFVGRQYKPTYSRLFDIAGFHVRHLDQLLRAAQAAPRRRRRVRTWVAQRWLWQDPKPQRFQGTYPLESAPIWSIPTPPKKKRVLLNAEETAVVNRACEGVLARLRELEQRQEKE